MRDSADSFYEEDDRCKQIYIQSSGVYKLCQSERKLLTSHPDDVQ